MALNTIVLTLTRIILSFKQFLPHRKLFCHIRVHVVLVVSFVIAFVLIEYYYIDLCCLVPESCPCCTILYELFYCIYIIVIYVHLHTNDKIQPFTFCQLVCWGYVVSCQLFNSIFTYIHVDILLLHCMLLYSFGFIVSCKRMASKDIAMD